MTYVSGTDERSTRALWNWECLMNKRSPNEFRRDIEMRQRNIVYPATLRNETRGWRNLITSKEPLSVLQVSPLTLAPLTIRDIGI